MDIKKLQLYIKKQEKEAEDQVRKIVKSDSCKKIIVSGPGTGKTHTFISVLEKKQKNCVALTFINNLADKLKKDLENKANSSTFHSFCATLLKKVYKDFILFPKLESIIKSDAQVFYNRNPNFSRSFMQLDNKSGNIRFFLNRANYYNTFSFDDSVYRVLKYFEEKPNEIPKLEQIVVDEYQDFNKLEVEFINILANKNPILIVGDDDQALYSQKYSSPAYIRSKWNDDPSYEKFELSYCRRCPLVITKAIADVISKAKIIHKLEERIDKKYICYLPKKLDDSKKYRKIVHAHCSVQQSNAPFISKFIEQEIDVFDLEEIKSANKEGDYTVLIIGPSQYLERIYSYLKITNKYDIYYKKKKNNHLTIVDGYKILLDKGNFSNLGWRIILEFSPPKNKKELIKKTKDNNIGLLNILPKDYIKYHCTILSDLRKIKNNILPSIEQINILENFFKIKLADLKTKLEEGFEKETEEESRYQKANIDKISIKLVTNLGCKGLSAGFVFVVGLNNGSLPLKESNPTDIEICKFIVALARTIKKCYLISNTRFEGKRQKGNSIFIDWIDQKRIERMNINADSFK